MGEETVDVVVVGAGMAGVTAARDLSAKGYSVTLLEARDRIGGRTYTAKGFGGELELGGGYVHWTQPNIWHELQKHGLANVTPPLQSQKLFWLADGKVHTGTEQEWLQDTGPSLQKLFAGARAQFPIPNDMGLNDCAEIDRQTIAERIDCLKLSPYERDCLEGALGGLICSPEKHGFAQLLLGAATYFGEFGALLETAGQWALAGGTKPVLDAMLADTSIKTRLNTAVASIDDQGSQVLVKTRDGNLIAARAAVVAVPINALGDISIAPDLPSSVRQMINERNPTMSSKVWARVKGQVEPFSALAPPGKHALSAVRAEKYRHGDTLFLCMCAEAAAIPSGAEERRKAVQDGLRVYVPDIEVVDTATHDWVSDEFSQGAWMMHRPGNLSGAARDMRKPHGRIYFAGADIAAVDAGSIEGAMASGAAAARDVVALLRDLLRPTH